MKLFLMMCLVVAGTVYGENHTFTLKDGRTLDAEIVAFEGGKVTLKRPDGKRIPVASDVFVDADIAYINEWAMFEGVRSSSKFKMSFDRRTISSWDYERLGTIHYSGGSFEENQVVGKTDFDEQAFEIELNNRNKYALSDLILEYNIYYEQEINTVDDEPGKYVLYDSMKLGSIGGQSKQDILTKSVIVYKDESNSEFINSRVLKGDVLGIVCRICTVQKGKKVVLRQESLPKSLVNTAVWTEVSKMVRLPEGSQDR
ncbi:hypothetical protein P4E94_15530 [Pontiellaceae bacterium B12219]|nr:hypothetical protein [Pontiellaceae bacterium B12219]